MSSPTLKASGDPVRHPLFHGFPLAGYADVGNDTEHHPMLGRRNLDLGHSTMIVSSRMKILVVAFAAGLLLTACGKRGPLEPPPGSTAAPAETNPDGTARDGLRNKRTPILPPKRDLLIDTLLD